MCFLLATFSRLSPCGANSAVPKEGCLVTQCAAGWCCCLHVNFKWPIHLSCLHVGLGLWVSVASSTCHFCPFLITTGLGDKVHVPFMPGNDVLGGVQCAQNQPHPLSLSFISYGPTSWDRDNEVFTPQVLCWSYFLLGRLPSKAEEVCLPCWLWLVMQC